MKCPGGAGEIAQGLKVCAVLSEDPGSVPCTHAEQLTIASNSKGLIPSSRLPGHLHTQGNQTHT